MNLNKISVRYAKAIFKLAKEKKNLDRVRSDFDLIGQVCKDIIPFQVFLENPVINTKAKVNVMEEVFKNKVQEETMNFLHLVVRNKREAFIPDMVRNFQDIYRHEKGIKKADFVTVSMVDDKLKNAIIAIIKKRFESEIEMTESIDSSLIGGFILRVEDRQLDASLKTKLKDLKRELVSGAVENTN